MRLNARCEMVIEAAAECAVVLMLRPQSGVAQTIVSSELNVPGGYREYSDAFGNLCQRVVLPVGQSLISFACTADVPDAIDVNPDASFTLIQDLPDNVLQYLLPSRYCESDLLLKLASQIVRKAAPPGYQQAEAIRHWIQRRMRYKYGVSNASTSAVDAVRKRAGVCRDFSHLGIALCRALRIPARMVFGCMHELDPMDLHAWFEAFVGGRWYTFDGTQKHPRGNRVVFAYGRDAADVAQLSEYGPLKTTSMSVSVVASEQQAA